jgi:predicted transcriptional regulator
MKTKRDRLQVIHDILKAIRDGKVKPTHILYKANLSHQMLEEYLKELIAKKFITEKRTKTGRIYALTEKGFDYLNKYKFIIEFSNSFGLN